MNQTGFLAVSLFCLSSLCCLLSSSDVPAMDVSLHGFVQGNYSGNTVTDNPDGKDYKWSEERAQIKLDASQDAFRFSLKGDAFYNNLDGIATTELREGYADYAGGFWDARVGRQIITWGVGDNVFINDVFPKDYNAFFTGRPLEYLKKGVDAVKFGGYPEFVSLELVAIPLFEPNTFPESRRFWMFDPLSGITYRKEREPVSTTKNAEVALRLYRDVAGFDTSLYFYRGYYRRPSVMPDNPMAPTMLTFFYPKLVEYGMSLQGRALDGVVGLEAGYYESREDKAGTNPLITNSQVKFLAGYQRQLWEDFTLGLQYYGENMRDYAEYEQGLPPGFPKERRLHQLATVRMMQFFLNQTMKLSFFAAYGLSDKEYMLNPEVKYNISDPIWLALGANVFGGIKPWSQFGQLAKNDNVYLQVRYAF